MRFSAAIVAVHVAEVADLGDPPELLRRDLVERREDRRERHVDPDVDGPESALDFLCRRLTLIGVGHIGR